MQQVWHSCRFTRWLSWEQEPGTLNVCTGAFNQPNTSFAQALAFATSFSSGWPVIYFTISTHFSSDKFSNIGDGQASHPHRQPGDSFAEVFYDLQSDLGVLKDQLFKLAAAETASQGVFKTTDTKIMTNQILWPA
jgi:hypothetical protein